MMPSVRVLINILIGDESNGRGKGERVWGEMDQGLLKRVGASLERTKILEKERSERRGRDRFMKKNEQQERNGERVPW